MLKWLLFILILITKANAYSAEEWYQNEDLADQIFWYNQQVFIDIYELHRLPTDDIYIYDSLCMGQSTLSASFVAILVKSGDIVSAHIACYFFDPDDVIFRHCDYEEAKKLFPKYVSMENYIKFLKIP